MTLRSLAKYAGCSVSTVSKAFSGSREISEETKNRIFSVARELGCYEKYSKEIYDKKLIAVLCPETNGSFYTELLSHLNNYISSSGGTMAISITSFSEEKENELLSFYSSQNHSDGIIIIDGKSQVKKHMAVPVVYLNSVFENHYTDVVNLDYYSGICDAIHYLKLNGHAKIGFVGETLCQRKRDFFYKAMKYHKLSIDESINFVSQKRFVQAGLDAMESLFASNNLPTAIIAAYDDIALGVIEAIERHGLSVPDDISVIGCDNIKLSQYSKIHLSSVDPDAQNACKIIVDRLFYRINNPSYCSAQQLTIRSQFIPRESAASIKNACV